jgi:3-dehydroquinate dehydratase/shikimate dehydrogenase
VIVPDPVKEWFMICVSIAQTSHKLAFVDMLNAGNQCDLLEIRLDRFEKSPHIRALIEASPKPTIVSCRRREDGGAWEGTQAARLTLLRQAVLDKADYVEIELDCADQVRRYGDTKRVITYTNTAEVPDDLEAIYAEACRKDPDVIKLTLPARTPEEAWPLLKIVAKGQRPTVAVGWGRNGMMLNILGRRYKAPWTYAALEKGMETYPGMLSIRELEDFYDYRAIDSKTPLLAVTGLADEQLIVSRVLNHGFRLTGNKTRCLPLEMGEVELFRKIAQAIKLAGVIVEDRLREQIVSVVNSSEEAVQSAGAADFIAIVGDQWRAFNVMYRCVVSSIEDALRQIHPAEKPLAGRTIVVVGCGPTARSIAVAVQKRGGAVVLADSDNDRAQRIARQLGCRFVATTQVYSTVADAMVLCRSDTDPQPGKAAIDIPRSVARESMLAVDLTNLPFNTPFLDEVRVLGGIAVAPVDVFVRLMQTVLKAYTGQTLTAEQLREPLAEYELDSKA